MKIFLLITLLVIFVGCSQKSVEHGASGAVAGAIGAGLVGALTDLIVDGRVDPYRLKRNIVAGALVGGTAGVIVGDNEHKKNKKQTPDIDKHEILKNKIGANNYTGLKYLILCKHNEAYRITLEHSKSSKLDYKLYAYVLQALIDKDRNNIAGMTNSLKNFIAVDKEISSMDIAKTELDKLYLKLQDERRILGQDISCQ